MGSTTNGGQVYSDVLLIHAPPAPDQEWITRIENRYPGFKIRWCTRPWNTIWEQVVLPKEEYEGVTMLCALNDVPAGLVPKLRYVQLPSAGADRWVQSPLYQDPNVVFCTSNGIHPPQIAEWVIGTYLMMSHHFLSYFSHQQQNPGVPAPKLLHLPVQDSPGLRMGILGYGAIGRQVARVAQAMGMEVYAYTRREKVTPDSRKDDSYCVAGTGDPDGLIPAKWFHGSSKEDVNRFLSQNLDVLVVSLPLTDSTRKILSWEQFDLLDKTAASETGTGRKTFVSNIARGEHIDTDALVDALRTGKIRGAALDVTDPEPLPEGHPLLKPGELDGKVFFTPHVSWKSPHYFERVLGIIERNLEALLGNPGEECQKKELINVMDREHHY